MAKNFYCSICGRETNNSKNICDKHAEQIKLWGFALDSNPRTENDANEIICHEDYAEIILYDKFQEEIEEKVIVDLEEVDRIKDMRWDNKNSCIVSDTTLLANLILNTTDKVEYIDNNYLNCKKSNLKIIENKSKKKKHYTVNKKNKNKVIVEILGKNNEQVTGSSTLVSIPLGNGEYKKVLIELGGNQTNKDLYTEYLLNKEIVDAIPHSEIDQVFVLHNHYDHIANLPALIPNGFKGNVITNNENYKLLLPMLLDGAFIMKKNIRAINNKRKHKVDPLYDEEDVYLLMNYCSIYSMNEIHKIDDTLSFQFVNAGHILGSCQLILYCKTPTGQVKKLHFTSDLGSNYNAQPFVSRKDIVTSSQFSMFEATYNSLDRGFKSKKECEEERESFKDLLKDELKHNRSILIGAFAQARQQSLMEFLYRSFKDDKDFKYTIYVDGVLGLNLNNVYSQVLKGDEKKYWDEILAWDKFDYVYTYEKSIKVAAKKNEPKIVLSSSGMFSGGRVVNHLKAMIENDNNTIVLCGYQGEGTVGHELQREDNKELKIEGMTYRKKAKIVKLNTWSSHIQAEENIKYMSQINTPLIVLNHSDEDNKFQFRDIVEEELRKRNNCAKVVCASKINSIFYV